MFVLNWCYWCTTCCCMWKYLLPRWNDTPHASCCTFTFSGGMQQSHFSPVYTWGLSKGSEYFLLHWSSLTKYQVTCCGRIKKKKKSVFIASWHKHEHVLCLSLVVFRYLKVHRFQTQPSTWWPLIKEQSVDCSSGGVILLCKEWQTKTKTLSENVKIKPPVGCETFSRHEKYDTQWWINLDLLCINSLNLCTLNIDFY